LAIGDAACQADHRNVYGLVALSLQASQHIRPLDAVCSRPPSKGAGLFLAIDSWARSGDQVGLKRRAGSARKLADALAELLAGLFCFHDL